MKTRSEKHKKKSKSWTIYKICLIGLLLLFVIVISVFAWKQHSPIQENRVSESTSTTTKRSSSKKQENSESSRTKRNYASEGGDVEQNRSNQYIDNNSSQAVQPNQDNNSNSSSSYPTGNDVAPGYVPGEGTKFAYNIARAGGLITGPHSFEQEDEFYNNSDMTDNSVTYNGQTVNYGKVYCPDGSYYYQVTPAK